MAISTTTIRKIRIEAETKGVDSAAASLKNVAAAEATVAKESDLMAAAQIKSAAAAERLKTAQDALAKSGSNSAVAQERVLLAQQKAIKADAELTASTERLRKAQFDLNAAKNYGASVTDIHTKKTLSAEDAYKRQATATNGVSLATQGMSKAISTATNVLGAFGVALGVGAMVAFGKSVFNTTADLQEQADQILGAGGNVEALQALRGIFLTNGVSQEQGDKILQRLTRSLGEAAEGSKKAQDAFHGMGLGAKELAGTTADAALPLVAKKLLEIEDATKRAALETQIFGKSGQQLESALKALAAGSMADLIARAKELGVVIDEQMIKKADEAKDKMALAFMKLQVAIAPIVVDWGDKFSNLVGDIESTTKAISDLWEKVKLFGGIGIGARVGFAVGGLPGAALGAAAGALGVAASNGGQTEKAVRNYEAQLAQPGLSPSERADIIARRDRAIATLNAGVGNTGLVTWDKGNGIESVTSSASRSGGSSWAPTSADVANAKKIEDSRHHVKVDDDAIKANADTILKAQLKQLEVSAKEDQHQQQAAAATEKYIDHLQTEVEFVGMSADERERQAAILEGIRVSEGKITDAQKGQIAATVSARQEAERWRNVVDDISYGFQGFFEDVLNTGKLSFQSLWESIKKSFIQMLAYMATQALINPIIVPMVGGIAGSLGGLGSLVSGGSSLGALSNMGSLGSMFGGGDILGLGSAGGLFSGLGSALGFSAGPTLGSLTSLGSISNGLGGLTSLGSVSSSLPALPGSLFGTTTLGGFLGGAGLGSLAGSLIFGNKNDAGLGSMGGAATGALIGSIIPGVGTIIGGLLGGVLGGGLGSLTGSSNQGAISNFTNGGLGNTLFKAGGGNNGALATQASGTINATLQALKDAGVDVSLGNISGLSIGSDKSYVYDFAGGKQKLAGGEAGVQATVNAILDRILGSATSGDSAVQELLQKYGSLNSGNIGAFSTELQAQAQAKQQKAAEDAAKAAADAAAEIKSLSAELDVLADVVSKAQDQLVRSYNAESAQITKTITYNQQQAASLREYLSQLRGGVSSGASYSAAKANFTSYVGTAGTDGFEASRLQQYGDSFLSASRTNSATLAQYRQDRNLVVSGVSSAASTTEGVASAAIRQLDALNASVEGLITLNQTTMSVKEAIEKLNEANTQLAAKNEANTAKIAKLLTSVTRDGEALLTEAA